MKSARIWLSTRLRGAIALLLLTEALFFGLGLPLVLQGYADLQTAQIIDQAREVLINPLHVPDEKNLPAGPFFVFSADGELVWSNRGKGRSIPESSRMVVEYQGVAIGSVYGGDISFFASEANQRFMVALGILLVLSLGAGMLVSAFLARKSGKDLSLPVEQIIGNLDAIAARKDLVPGRSAIEEFALIDQGLGRLQDQLRANDLSQRQFLQDLGHDLRTPLGGLRSQLEGLADGVLLPEPGRYQRMLKELDRMETMVQDLASLFRIENQAELKHKAISLQHIHGLLLGSFEHALVQEGASLVLEPADTDQYVWADQQGLERALGNLVANSLRYGGPGVQISLGLGSFFLDGKPYQELFVADTGPGVKHGELALIFQRLYRGEYARTSEGTGLGLSIVEAIARRHGGWARASLWEKGGLRVSLFLPAGPGEQEFRNA